jgi:hypothetical protein
VHGQSEVVEELGAREHEDDKEDLVVLVCVEDNFAILAQGNNEGVEFLSYSANMQPKLFQTNSFVLGVVNLMLEIM